MVEKTMLIEGRADQIPARRKHGRARENPICSKWQDSFLQRNCQDLSKWPKHANAASPAHWPIGESHKQPAKYADRRA